MKLEVVSVSYLRTAIRVLTLLLIFLSSFICDLIFNKELCDKYLGVWLLLIIIFFLLQLFFINRYKVIGSIAFKEDQIILAYIRGKKEVFEINDKLAIKFTYNSYKGQGDSLPPLFVALRTREGINKLTIENSLNNVNLKILVNKGEINRILRTFNFYLEKNARVILKQEDE